MKLIGVKVCFKKKQTLKNLSKPYRSDFVEEILQTLAPILSQFEMRKSILDQLLQWQQILRNTF